ncbi:MAG TPA: FHA domain-containing protein [Acidobacteriota bacterium]|nr:FHA domain-containing protein [Acidobacteriota bacterium]
MASRRTSQLLPVLLILLTVTWTAAAVDPGQAELYRRQYAGSLQYLRVNIFENPYTVHVYPDRFVLPSRGGLNALLSAGEPVRVQGVTFGERTVDLAVTAPNGTRGVTLRFAFDEPLDPPFSSSGVFMDAVAAVFTATARVGKPGDDARPPDEEEPETPQTEEPEPEDEKETPRDEIRLLVEPGADTLPGDGDTVTTVTVSARNPDGRLLDHLAGPVDIRINAGRLAADRIQMSGGIARTNLQVPILDDRSKMLLRSLQLTSIIIRKVMGAGPGADYKAIALEEALKGPNAAALNTAEGDKPWVLIVAEFAGVKGKGKINLTPSTSPVSGISGYYEGTDVTGASEWSFDAGRMILMQKGYRDEVKVEFTGTHHMGFYGVSVGGIGTSLIPLPGDQFFLIAPPIMFHRVSSAPQAPEAPAAVKPKPTVTLTARDNPVAGDGQSTTPVVFQFMDAQGRPRAGVRLTWKLDFHGVFSTDQRGRLLSNDPVTGADGTARAVYQSPAIGAKDMQQTGSIKNRDVVVEYAAGEDSGRVICQIGVMKAAPVRLVVEKPGLERSVLPLQIASLNGFIKGRVLLKVTTHRLPGTATRVPVNDATVKLEGDEKILKWAAVDVVKTDDEGQFTIQMHMSNWPRWDKELKQPFLVAPSARLLGLQHNALQHLEKWPASDEVKERSQHFVQGAQTQVAESSAEDAEGLVNKMELFGWMLLVLKDTRKDATDAGQELLGHAWTLFQAAASYFYADSKLDKYVKDKYKQLEKTVGLRKLQALKARWEKSQSAPSSVSGRIYRWLFKWFFKTPPVERLVDNRQTRRVTRSMLNELILPQIIKRISDFLGEYVPEMPFPDIKGAITSALLAPYDDLANQFLILFLENDDYDSIRAAYARSYAKLKVRHDWLAREYQQMVKWRIAEEWLTVLVDTISECGQVAMKIIGTIYLQPEIVKHAETLEKIQKVFDNVMAGVRFVEECYRFVGILNKSLDVVMTTTADLAGTPVQALLLRPGAGGSLRVAQAGLLPGSGDADTPRLELADNMEWDAFTASGGRVSADALAYLIEADEAVAAWEMATVSGLFALHGGAPDRMQAYTDGSERWESLRRRLRLLALRGLERPLTAAERGDWERSVERFQAETETYQTLLDDTAAAIDDLPPAADAVMIENIRRQTGGSFVSRVPAWVWFAAGALLAVIVAAVLLGLALSRRSRRRAVAAAIPQQPVPAYPSPTPSFPPTPPPAYAAPAPGHAAPLPPAASVSPRSGPLLRDNLGRAHALVVECVTLGAATDNTIVLPVPGVSQHHARIWRTPQGTFWIEDLGSTNGVYIDAQRCASGWLTPGAVITLGQWQARFETGL